MQFVANGPDIPDELLQAHEEGNVVLFLRSRHLISGRVAWIRWTRRKNLHPYWDIPYCHRERVFRPRTLRWHARPARAAPAWPANNGTPGIGRIPKTKSSTERCNRNALSAAIDAADSWNVCFLVTPSPLRQATACDEHVRYHDWDFPIRNVGKQCTKCGHGNRSIRNVVVVIARSGKVQILGPRRPAGILPHRGDPDLFSRQGCRGRGLCGWPN